MTKSANVPKSPQKRDHQKDRHLRITYPKGSHCAVASVEGHDPRHLAIAVFPCMVGSNRVEIIGRTSLGVVAREVAREQLLELSDKLKQLALEL